MGTKLVFLQLTRLLISLGLPLVLSNSSLCKSDVFVCVCVCVWFFPLRRPETGSQWVEILPFKNLISFFGMTALAPGSFSAQSINPLLRADNEALHFFPLDG